MKAADIADILGKNKDAVRKTLARMWDGQEIEKTARGLYTCLKCPNVPTNSHSDIVTHGTGGESVEEEEYIVWQGPDVRMGV